MKKYFQTILRLWNLLKPFQKHFYIQLILTIIDQLINIGITYIFARALNLLIAKDVSSLLVILGIYLVVGILRNRLSLFKSLHQLTKLDNQIQQYLEEYSFENIFKLNISQFTDDHSSIKLQVINRGESAIQDIIQIIAYNVIPTVVQIIFTAIAISFYSKATALWCLFVLIIATYWANKFAESNRPNVKKNISNWDNQRKIRSEAFQHLAIIKLFSAENTYLKKYLENRHKIIDFGNFVFTRGFKNGHLRQLFVFCGRVIAFILIIRAYLRDFVSTGGVYAVWAWMNDMFGNIQNIVQATRMLPLRFAELEKYLDVIDKEPEFKEGGKSLFKNGNIVFKNVSLHYKNSETASLNNVSFEIVRGQKVALVGASGGGKSSLVKLLLRAYDYTAGSITIDGVELRDFDYKSLRTHIGYVEQHVDLFDTSIKENLLLGLDYEVSEENLGRVAKSARIMEFYHRLGEKGLDTEIGERGVKLSGGERQRVGIARALLRNPEILIFDEATSALDTENEHYIKEAIDEASKGRTTIIIAHRLSTVRDADKIIVMDKGTVVAEGTHEVLLQASSHYQTLIAHQISE